MDISDPETKKGCDARLRLTLRDQAVFCDVTSSFFTPCGCTLLLASACGACSPAVVELLHARLTHCYLSEQTARVFCALGLTAPKSAHRILQEVLAPFCPTTNTNGHTYQGLLQILARTLESQQHFHGIILEVPSEVTDTAELATVLADIRKIQLATPTLSISILVTAAPHHALSPDLFTAVVAVTDPSPDELKHIVRSILPTATEELAARIVAYAYRLHTYVLTPTASHSITDTVTELANIIVANTDTDADADEISTQTATEAFHTLIGRTVAAKLTQTRKTNRIALVSPSTVVAAAIDAHAAVLKGVETDEENNAWVSLHTIYRQFLTITQSSPGEIAFEMFTKTIPPIVAAGLLIAHPAGKAAVTLNPILTDTRIIPHILNPQKIAPTKTRTHNPHPRKSPAIPQHINHIALLAALVKTEQTTHPSKFPTHRAIYTAYQKLCTKFNITPKPLYKVYHAIQSLKKQGFIHVHRAHTTQGRPNQLLHHLSPNDITLLRAKIHTITHPHTANDDELNRINAHLNAISTTTRSTHKLNVISTIATIATHTTKTVFNASNAYTIYSQTTPNPITKHAFLTAIRNLINDKILTPLYRSINLSLNLTLTLPPEPLKPPP